VKGKILNKLLFIGFVMNLLFLASILAHLIFILANPDLYIKTIRDPDNYLIITILYSILCLPTLFLLVYNIYFLFKYDKYSKSIIPLFLFNIIYSPYYYYRVKIKRKNLMNELKVENVLDNKIHLEVYDNEEDLEKDLEGLGKKFGG
jgi:hypothetical protein